MAVIAHLRSGGVRAFYRRGADDGLIYFANHTPTDEELGKEEWRAFWAKGGRSVEVYRDSYML